MIMRMPRPRERVLKGSLIVNSHQWILLVSAAAQDHRHSLSRSSFSLKSCSRDSWLLLFSQSSTGTWASDFVDLVVLFFRRVLGEGLPATEAVGFDFFWKFIFDHPGRWVVMLDSAFQSTSDHHSNEWSTSGQIQVSSHFQPFLWAIVSFYWWFDGQLASWSGDRSIHKSHIFRGSGILLQTNAPVLFSLTKRFWKKTWWSRES